MRDKPLRPLVSASAHLRTYNTTCMLVMICNSVRIAQHTSLLKQGLAAGIGIRYSATVHKRNIAYTPAKKGPCNSTPADKKMSGGDGADLNSIAWGTSLVTHPSVPAPIKRHLVAA